MAITFQANENSTFLDRFRRDYLNTLVEPQELYLEFIVRKGNYFLVFLDNQPCGYFIIGEKDQIAEFYVADSQLKYADEIFNLFLNSFSVQGVLCKSFDFLLMSQCLRTFSKHKIIGFMFRDVLRKNRTIYTRELFVRPGFIEDFTEISRINDTFYQNDEELVNDLKNQHLLLFYQNRILIGCGFFQRVIPFQNNFDIGMLVNPAFRGKGYGKFIIQYLVNYCRSNGWRPICGCDVGNIASRKTLEKAGFMTRYVLLSFSHL
ncbi:GNAT family N-acetyltransferase [candidate division KSB1 bacterium]|nr:GNAT family N-acetyltransferase [candidate division KSB1 bacterium]